MRETIGGTWITQLVIVFIFVFVAFLALSLNYSKAFRVKNETLTFIEKNEGFTNKTIEKINNYLVYTGYNTKGKCEVGSMGVLSLNNPTKNNITESDKNKEYFYCVTKVKSKTTNFKYRAYYKVKLFFKFNLPVVGDIVTFNITGQTKDVIYPADDSEVINNYEIEMKNSDLVKNRSCSKNSEILRNATDVRISRNETFTISLKNSYNAKNWYISRPNMVAVSTYNTKQIKLKMLRRGSTQICAESQNGSNCDCITITVE